MNIVVLTGRMTADPDIRVSQGQEPLTVSHFTLAVDRERTDAQGNSQADFIRCVVFGRRAEWMQKYTHKGMKLEVSGRWQTGKYTNQQGATVYTNDCICNTVNFGESKSASQHSGQNSPQGNYQNGGSTGSGQAPQGGYQNAPAAPPQQQYQQQTMYGQDGFMNIPPGLEEELPFN